MRGFLGGFGLTLALLVGACSQADNQQFLPIGTRCTDSNQCGTKPYFCRESGYPGGYCEKPCTADGDCPSDSVCSTSVCRRKCTSEAQCRSSEGYSCKSIAGVTTSVCELTVQPIPDGGASDL